MPKLTNWGPKVKKKGGGSGGKYVNNKSWKEDGKLTFWLHPGSMVDDRETLMLPVASTNDDGEKKIGWVRRFTEGEDDFASVFLAWLGEQDDIDADDVVLKLRHGKDRKDYRKGDLLGLKGFGWEGKILNSRVESIMCIVPHEDPAVRLIALPISAGKRVWKVIEDSIDDLGEDEGNPQVNPYAIKVTYDKNAKRGADKYDANSSQIKITDEIEACFEEKAHDVEAECSPSGENYDDHGTTKEIVQALCIVDCPLWDMESADPEPEEDDGDEMPEDFGAKKNPRPEPEPEDDEPEEEEEDEEGDEDEGLIHPIDAGDAEEGATYTLEDDTEVTFVRVYRKRAVFEDEDGQKHRLALDAMVWPVESDEDDDDEEDETEESEAGDDDDDEVQVRDCKVGSMYLDSDGDLVEFLEFDKSADEGIFKDHEGDDIRYEGDDYMSPTGKKKA